MSEPIFGHLEHAWRTAEGDISRLFHHGRYHQPSTTVPKGNTPMNLTQLEADIRGDVQAVKDKATEVLTHSASVLEQHLPQLADLATKAESNPLVDAALAAVHLSPELLQGLAKAINEADAALSAVAGAVSVPEPPDGPAQPETPGDGSQAADSAPADGQNQTGIAV